MFYLLTVKIFRTDPNLAPVVADVLDGANNATESRASLKRKAQIAKHKQLLAKDAAMNPPPVSIKVEKTLSPSSSVTSIANRPRSMTIGRKCVSPKPWNKPAMLE